MVEKAYKANKLADIGQKLSRNEKTFLPIKVILVPEQS